MALIRPQIEVSPTSRPYDGRQLRSHWIYETFDLRGDAAVAFIGPVEVRDEDLVDLADKKDGLFIAGDSMLHLIVESFGPDLDRAVMFQRMLVTLCREALDGIGVEKVVRKGDDLFVDGGKLSVSIATVSGVSSLVHFGINVTTEGTPVKTAALQDLGIEPLAFADRLLTAYADELESMALATSKVRSVP